MAAKWFININEPFKRFSNWLLQRFINVNDPLGIPTSHHVVTYGLTGNLSQFMFSCPVHVCALPSHNLNGSVVWLGYLMLHLKSTFWLPTSHPRGSK